MINCQVEMINDKACIFEKSKTCLCLGSKRVNHLSVFYSDFFFFFLIKTSIGSGSLPENRSHVTQSGNYSCLCILAPPTCLFMVIKEAFPRARGLGVPLNAHPVGLRESSTRGPLPCGSHWSPPRQWAEHDGLTQP